jgi:rod shape-determining protein MreC
VPSGKKYTFLALLTLTTCVLAIYIHQHRQGQTRRIDGILITLVGSLQKHFFSVGHGTRAIADHYLFLVNAKKENDELVREVETLRAQVGSLKEVELENSRLRETLHFREKLDQKVVLAHVVSHDAAGDYFGLRVDKGSVDGIKEGMGVVSPSGVVGRILRVAPHFSLVQTLIDPASNVDVVVQRSRARGILSGQRKKLECMIRYLDKLEDVQVNDTIISTDFNGVFPKGLVAGYVTAVVPNSSGILQTVLVKSAVDIFRLEEVSIVFPRIGSEKGSDNS